MKLLVLAQARQWLPATERLDPIADAPPTPKTNFQLADAIKQLNGAEYAPFGCDFEDAGAYSPVISRLLLYAEIHNCSDHDYGTFSTPKEMMPYTYRQLQEWIVERRRLQQRSDAAQSSSRELVGTADDLAARLCAFASDGIVVMHLIWCCGSTTAAITTLAMVTIAAAMATIAEPMGVMHLSNAPPQPGI